MISNPPVARTIPSSNISDLSQNMACNEMTTYSFDELRNKARDLERQIEWNLNAYDVLGQQPKSYWHAQFRISENMIEQVSQIIQQLSRIDPQNLSTQHHQQKLKYHQQNYKYIKNSYIEKQAREELFSHSSTLSNDDEGDVSLAVRTMLQDRQSILRSHGATLAIINGGEEIKRLLRRSGKALLNTSDRLQNTLSQFHHIDHAFQVIRRAKIKNTVIIGLVIAICICIYLWLLLR